MMAPLYDYSQGNIFGRRCGSSAAWAESRSLHRSRLRTADPIQIGQIEPPCKAAMEEVPTTAIWNGND
jgi:hypothetical protein